MPRLWPPFSLSSPTHLPIPILIRYVDKLMSMVILSLHSGIDFHIAGALQSSTATPHVFAKSSIVFGGCKERPGEVDRGEGPVDCIWLLTIVSCAQVFEADLLENHTTMDRNLPVALKVKSATFRWVTAGLDSDVIPEITEKPETEGESPELDRPNSEDTLTEPFSIQDLSLEIPRGRLVGLVGPVGSGKSSLLQGVSEFLKPLTLLTCA